MSCCYWLHVSKGQTILLQWCDLASSGDGSTLSGDCSTIRTISNTMKMMWYKIAFHPILTTDTCTQYKRQKPKIYGLHRCFPKDKLEVEKCLLVLAPTGFLWNDLRSVSHYIMGPLSGWWRQGGTDQQCLAAPIWKYRSGFGDHRFNFFHRFASKLHILHKYDKYCPLDSCL